MGWFPESYVEKVSPSVAANTSTTVAASPAPKLALQSQLSNALEAAKASGTKSAFTPTHSPNSAPSETQGQVRVDLVYANTHGTIPPYAASSFASVYLSAGGGERSGPGLVLMDGKDGQPSELQ